MLVFGLCFVLLWSVISGKRTVHILPHSHCDPGWLESTDMYYIAEVRPIIDRTIAYLMTHPEAKYNWVESIYLHMWWEEASAKSRANLLHLIKETKQWEIVMGGWVMNDQACVTYSSSIDQMTLGHVWLQSVLGDDVCPDQGFTLDPFGSTPTQTYIYSLAGFDSHTIWRIPYTLMDEYSKDQTLEFHWHDPNSVMSDPGTFTHILRDGYGGPGGYQFWNPGSGNPAITPANIADRSANLIKIFSDRASDFLSKEHLMMIWGGDFAYTCPTWIFDNTTLLINYINSHSEYSKDWEVKYSTVNEYFDAVRKEKSVAWPRKTRDFFVYDDGPDAFWSGYFVSQPRLKLRARQGETFARVAETIYSLAYVADTSRSVPVFESNEFDDFFLRLWRLRDKNGQIRHHDAITGTEKWAVSDFYVQELDLAVVDAKETTGVLFSSVACPTWTRQTGLKAIVTPAFTNQFLLTVGTLAGFYVYNPLGWARTEEFVEVSFWVDDEGNGSNDIGIDITNQDLTVVYPSSIAEKTRKYGMVQYRVVFRDDEGIPALGFKYFVVKVYQVAVEETNPKSKSIRAGDTTLQEMENEFYKIGFDFNNKISTLLNKKAGIEMTFGVDLQYFQSFSNPNNQSSGAYIFRPASSTTKKVAPVARIEKILDTELFSEVTQSFGDYVKCTIRLLKGSKSTGRFFDISFDQVGVIPEDHEVVVTFDTQIGNGMTVYHDALGLEMKKKIFEKTTKHPAAANHYPMQYAAFIQDQKARLTVLTTKAQSVGSMRDGQLDMMIHRRTSQDDWRGVNQPLQDTFVITKDDHFVIRVMLEAAGSSAADDLRHRETYLLNNPSVVYPLIHDFWNKHEVSDYPSDFLSQFSFLKNPLPKEVNLLSLNRVQMGDPKSFVLRLNNVYEDTEESTPVSVNPSDLFVVQPKQVHQALLTLLKKSSLEMSDEAISIKPIDIKTFEVEF